MQRGFIEEGREKVFSAARRGSPDAKYEIAQWYYGSGGTARYLNIPVGITRDWEEAARWARRIIEQDRDGALAVRARMLLREMNMLRTTD